MKKKKKRKFSKIITVIVVKKNPTNKKIEISEKYIEREKNYFFLKSSKYDFRKQVLKKSKRV